MLRITLYFSLQPYVFCGVVLSTIDKVVRWVIIEVEMVYRWGEILEQTREIQSHARRAINSCPVPPPQIHHQNNVFLIFK